jgi:acetamidase/formamidase
MSREHVIEPRLIHHDWDETLPPILKVESGDVVHFDLLEAGNGQVKPGDRFDDVPSTSTPCTTSAAR